VLVLAVLVLAVLEVVALAQPTVSATGTAVAASAIVSRLDPVMTIRRIRVRRGSGRHPRPRAGTPGDGAAEGWC